jgi:hypothetical protein
MFRKTAYCAWSALLLLLVVACSTENAPPMCVPGLSAACACANGSTGHQVCMDDGSGFAKCSCEDTPPDDVESIEDIVEAVDTTANNEATTWDTEEVGEAVGTVETTPDAEVCVPDCVAKNCGPDECGGSCGTCDNDQFCTALGRCVCAPECSGKECGDDGCGGDCGPCSGYEACVSPGLCEKVAVIDGATGLVWQIETVGKTWTDAKDYCSSNSAELPGSGWHLPNIDELRTLIAGCPSTAPGGSCSIHADCDETCPYVCSGCEYLSGPGPGGLYTLDSFETYDWGDNYAY